MQTLFYFPTNEKREYPMTPLVFPRYDELKYFIRQSQTRQVFDEGYEAI